jgi:D-alanine-D-alanine ligase
VRLKGVKTADSVVLPQRAPDAAKSTLELLLKKHGRVVVKPVADGSSVGLYHVGDEADIAQVAKAVSDDAERAYLAEAFLQGREMTCGVIEQDAKARALPPSEVLMDEGRAFDFEGKYLGKGTREVTPAEAPKDVLEAVQTLAVTAHEALGCRGYTRTDVIVTGKGAYFLETNTLPGMTKASFIPQQLAAAGIDVKEFLHEQLRIARARQ